MRGKKVPEELKIKIIEESLSDGCVVGELARRYNLTSKTIISWRSAYIKLRSSSKFTKDLVNNSPYAKPLFARKWLCPVDCVNFHKL